MIASDETRHPETEYQQKDVGKETYAQEGKEIGEIYTGFLHLGKLYYKRTGKRLSFVAMSINRKEKYLRFGEPIVFDPTVPFAQEKERITEALLQELRDDY